MVDYNEIFDAEIKAALKGAEERVPSSVWKSVSGSLSQRAAFDWRRAGLIAAAAAAVCCCLVLVGTLDRHEAEEVVLADVPSANTELVIAVADVPVVESVKPAKSVPIVAKVIPVAEDNREVIQTAQETVENNVDSNTDNINIVNSADNWSDPFAEEEEIKQGKTRRTVLDIKGAFSTNSSSIKFVQGGMQGAPAYITGGIEDISQSSYGLPFTVGVGVRWYLGRRFSLGTGVDYSLLTRKFSGNYYPKDDSSIIMLNADIFHSLSYIGVPVNAYFDIIQHSLVGLYVFGGVEVERAVANNYRISSNSVTQYYNEAVCGCQYSTQLGLGVEFKLTDYMGIYFDPCLKFYLNSDQPTSMRTQQPLMFSGAIGLKFDLLRKE